MDRREILDLIAEMKAKAKTPHDRQICDTMAVGIITQEIETIKMADNLQYWLDLTKTITPLYVTGLARHRRA